MAKQQLKTRASRRPQVSDWATLVTAANKPEVYDVFSTAITFNPEPAYNTSLQCNWPGWWCHEDKERWLDSVARESEPRKRKAMWDKVQQHFYEDAGRIKFGDFFNLEVTRKDVRGYRRLYEDHVLQANEGCDLDFLRGRSPVVTDTVTYL